MEILILLVILIYVVRNNKKRNSYGSGRCNAKKRHNPSQWQSEWVWNEEKQLWIHPLSGDSVLPQKIESEEVADLIDFSSAYQPKYLLTYLQKMNGVNTESLKRLQI